MADDSMSWAGKYHILDDMLAVYSESPWMSAHIQCFMKKLAVDDSVASRQDVRLLVFEAPDDHVIMCAPEVGFVKKVARGRASWIAFRRLLIHLALTEHRPHYVLHASCIGDDEGNAAILAGSSNAGKTLLLAALLRRGYRLVADDYTIVRFEDTRVVSFPIGVTITETASDLLPHLKPLRQDACKFYCEEQWQWTVNLGDIHRFANPSDLFEPKCIVFVDPHFGNVSHMNECGREEARSLLIANRFSDSRLVAPMEHCDIKYRQQAEQTVNTLLEKARSFYLYNGDLEQSANLVAEQIPLYACGAEQLSNE